MKTCSARLLTHPQERLPAKVEYALRATTWALACLRLRVHHRSGLPVVHSVSGTKSGRTFREIDGRTSLTPALTSCRARCAFGGWFAGVSSDAATQGLGRKEYGAGTDPTEREWQPYTSTTRRIRMGSSGDNLESGDFSYGRRRTFLKTFGHWEYTVSRLIEYPLSHDFMFIPAMTWELKSGQVDGEERHTHLH